MEQIIEVASWIYFVVVLASCIVFSFIIQKTMREEQPGVIPYRWGYFCGCFCLSNTWMVVVMVILAAIQLIKGEMAQAVVCIVTLVPVSVLSCLGAGILKRKKWAWVILAIVTGPIGWLVNGYYAYSRWQELEN